MKRYILFIFIIIALTADGTTKCADNDWTYLTGPGTVNDMKIQDDILYCATETGLLILNTADMSSNFIQYDNRLISIDKGDDDAIWLGSQDWLLKYENDTITEVSWRSPVTDICVIDPNTVWFLLDNSEDNVRRYIYSKPIKNWQMPSVIDIFSDPFNNFYVATKTCIYKYTNDEFDPIFNTNWGITCVTCSDDGTIWAGGSYIGNFVSYDGSSWQTHSFPDDIGGFKLQQIRSAPDGTIWAVIPGNRIAYYDGQWSLLEDESSIEGTIITIEMDSDNMLWCSTHLGLFYYKNNMWNKVKFASSPLANTTCVAQEQDGTVWFGTNEGLGRYDGDYWNTYTEADGLSGDDVTAIAVSTDGIVWAGTTNGVSRFDGNTFRNYDLHDGLPYLIINDVAIDKYGTCWFATDHGAAYIQNDTVTALDDPEELMKNVTHISLAPDGSAWFSALNMIVRFIDGELIPYTTLDGLRYLNVNNVLVIGNDVYGLTIRDRLSIAKYDGGSYWESLPLLLDERIAWGTHYTGVGGDGAIWTHVGEGLWRFKDGVWMEVENELSNYVNDIVPGVDGSTWFATGAGLVSYKEAPMGYPVKISEKQPSSLNTITTYPNPFNNTTAVTYYVNESGTVSIDIYNIAGQKVYTLCDSFKQSGRHTDYWNGMDFRGNTVSNGLYFLQLSTNDTHQVGRIMYLK